MTITDDSNARKNIPLARGLLDYFPAALAEVARLSMAGNEKHNPGEELHHARGKSGDHADCILRHLTDRGTDDTDGFLHDVKVAWRALALLQETLEALGEPLARGAHADTYSVGEAMAFIEGFDYAQAEAVLDELALSADEYGRPLDAHEPTTLTDEQLADWVLCNYIDTLDGFGDVDALDEERDALPGRTEPAEGFTSTTPAERHHSFVANCISNRIAGDSEEAKEIKNPYYGHNPDEVAGYCVRCDALLTVDDEHVSFKVYLDEAEDWFTFCACGLYCKTRFIEEGCR